MDEKKQLKECGFALYGPRWQTSLARALGLSDGRRVRQWLSGDRPIPAGVWEDIKGFLQIRKLAIDKVLHDLSNKIL